jgi:hypothetical protein
MAILTKWAFINLFLSYYVLANVMVSVAKTHNFYAAPAPAPSKNLDAAPAAPVAPDPDPTVQYSKATFLKGTKA